MLSIRPLASLSILLVVVSSGCSVSPSTDESPSSAPQRSPAAELTLLADGIGPFIFGDSAQGVIEGVTATIGGWDADSSASGDEIDTPACEGGPSRAVSWGSLVLTFVARSDGEALAGWSYGFDPLTANSDDLRGLDLETVEGIGLGSTRANLADAYGSKVVISDNASIDAATFVVAADTPTRLSGKLNASGPGGHVDFLETEPLC